MLTAKGGPFSLLSVYAYSIFRIQEYKHIDSGNLSAYLTIAETGKNLLLQLITCVVFLFLLGAIVFALLARCFAIWVTAAFSPLFGLVYFFDNKLP